MIEVWTDGACSNLDRIGGWAWATENGYEDTGSESDTTSQRMELTAALEAIKAWRQPITIVSDSAYLVNCFRDSWFMAWREKNWISGRKIAVLNQDIWRPLIAISLRYNVQYRKTKGHSTDEMNNYVDRLAVTAKEALRYG